jgi:hypothetical protein
LDNAQVLYDGSRAWAEDVLSTTTSIDTPDDSLDLALEWAKINLEEQRVCNPDLGCGFVAGWGISGASTRPGFGWFFGGDAAINSLAMDATGQWELVAEDLRFLARYQRDDGKIPHEVSQAAGRMPWFEDYPYPYYHADTTPYWMVAVWELWKASGSDEWLTELWPAYQKAWAWCLTAETDGDGIIENTVGGYGAIEVGGLGENLHQDIYLACGSQPWRPPKPWPSTSATTTWPRPRPGCAPPPRPPSTNGTGALRTISTPSASSRAAAPTTTSPRGRERPSPSDSWSRNVRSARCAS